MSHYVLDTAFRITTETGVAAHRVVTIDSDPGSCRLPAAAGAHPVLGITTHAQPRAGSHVGVRRLGVALATAAGAIDRGARISVADALGRIRAVPRPRYTFGTSGANNVVHIDWLKADLHSAGLLVEIREPASDGAFAWEWVGGTLVFYPTKADDAITMTAAQLVAAVNGNSGLTPFVTASLASGASGSGVVVPVVRAAANLADLGGAFAVAEEAATAAGDIIPVLLTL